MKRFLITVTLLVSGLVTLSNCSFDSVQREPLFVSVAFEQTWLFPAEGGICSYDAYWFGEGIRFWARKDWTLTCDVDWISITPDHGKGTEENYLNSENVVMIAEENTTGAIRYATIRMTLSDGAYEEMPVIQYAYEDLDE